MIDRSDADDQTMSSLRPSAALVGLVLALVIAIPALHFGWVVYDLRTYNGKTGGALDHRPGRLAENLSAMDVPDRFRNVQRIRIVSAEFSDRRVVAIRAGETPPDERDPHTAEDEQQALREAIWPWGVVLEPPLLR